MKRKKSSNRAAAATTIDVDHGEVEDPRIPFLPVCIVKEILSRVSVKSISRFKSVCKLWLDILSSSDFAKLHFSRAPTCPLLWNPRPKGTRLSGNLYLVEFERDIVAPKSDKSTNSDDSCYGYHSSDDDDDDMCCEYDVDVKLAANFGLPKLADSDSKAVRVMDIVNSCNGLLCLRNDPVVIYNPLLRECVTLPKPETTSVKDYVLGLGFSTRTNQYKVLRATPHSGLPNVIDTNRALAEVHTLGTPSWRGIGSVPISITHNDKISFPTFVNGAFHWFVGNTIFSRSPIISFKFNEEEFGEIEPPVRSKNKSFMDYTFMGIGELRGCLYISESSCFSNITIWVMKDHGVETSWTKDFKMEWDDANRWPRGFYKPISILSNGDLLMYHWNNAIISYNGSRYKYFKIRESKSRFIAIAYTPSFVSLKDVMGDNVTVLSVRLRGRRNKKGKQEDASTSSPGLDNFELSEEPTKAIVIVKERPELATDFHGDSDEARDYEDDC